MKNKYILLFLLCLCRPCLCRRRPGSGSFGDPEVAIIAIFILLPNVGGWISYAIARKLSNRLANLVWVQNLTIPHWCWYIPDWTFAVVWTILYTLMGCASYMVYKNCNGFTVDAALPLSLYGGQLLLNWSWSPVCVGFRKVSFGFFHYLALDAVTMACAVIFLFINKIAFYLMLPYLVFLAFLTIYTYIIWRTNMDTIKTLSNKI